MKTLVELFSDAKRWTQEAFARSKAGGTRLPSSPDAVCWCLWGGVLRVYSGTAKDDGTVRDDVIDKLVAATGQIASSSVNRTSILSRYNDSHTHSEVLALCEAAGV